MRFKPTSIAVAAAALAAAMSARAGDANHDGREVGGADQRIQLGPRPFYLVQGMDEGPLKNRLASCQAGPFERTDFSIGHRGAALQFPEHTVTYYANCMGLK